MQDSKDPARSSISDGRGNIDSVSLLESTFFIISNLGRRKKENICRVTWDEFFINWLKVFEILFFVTLFVVIIPTQFTNAEDNTKSMFYFELFIVLLLSSFIWVGSVYSIQEFRGIWKTKILPMSVETDSTESLLILLRCHYDGIEIDFRNKSFRISILSSIFIFFFVVIFITIAIALISLLPLNLIWPNMFSLTLVVFLFYNVFLIISSSLLSLAGLLIFQQKNPDDVNLYLEMGGTEKYGKFVINCISVIIFALSAIPVAQFANKNSPSFIPSVANQLTNINQIGNLSVQQISSGLHMVSSSVTTMPISKLADYWVYFAVFAICIILSLSVILTIHFNIRRKKEEELAKIENEISEINFDQIYDRQSWQKKQYFLSLYENILNLYEWPIRKITIVQIILSIISVYFFFIDHTF